MREFYVESTDSFITEIETVVVKLPLIKTVRGVTFKIDGAKRIVTETNEEVFDCNIVHDNSEKLFTKYSVENNLMTGKEARILREQLKVSQKEFANLVGVPEIAIVQIETGSLISDESNKLLRDFKATINDIGVLA